MPPVFLGIPVFQLHLCDIINLILYKGDNCMFRNLRKEARKIDSSEAIEILKAGEYGVMSTMGDNGYAYGVPLSYVYFNDAIYFHCAKEGHKLDNIAFNSNVSFCVVGKTESKPEKFTVEYESAIVFGKASEVLGDEKLDVLFALIDKYSHDYIEQGKEYINRAHSHTTIIKISIEHITGKASN